MEVEVVVLGLLAPNLAAFAGYSMGIRRFKKEFGIERSEARTSDGFVVGSLIKKATGRCHPNNLRPVYEAMFQTVDMRRNAEAEKYMADTFSDWETIVVDLQIVTDAHQKPEVRDVAADLYEEVGRFISWLDEKLQEAEAKQDVSVIDASGEGLQQQVLSVRERFVEELRAVDW